MTARRRQGWLRRLVGYVGRHRRDTLLSFGAALLGTVVTAAVPLLARRVVDDAAAHSTRALAPYVVLLLVAGLARFGLAFLRRYTGGRLSLDVQFDLRDDVFTALQRLDAARQDELDTGQLVSRASSDITLVQGLLSFLPNLSGQALLFVLSLGVMAVLSPLLTLVALLVGPALAVIARRSRVRLFPATWDAQQQAGEVAGVVEEDVTGVRVVKGFGQERRELGRLTAAARVLYARRLRAVRLSARFSPALQAVPALGQVGVLLAGGLLVAHGRLTVGTFLAFSTYLAELVSPVRILAGLLTITQQAGAGMARVLEVIDTAPAVLDSPGAHELGRIEGRVELRRVRFGYVASRPVLDGVDLVIEPGETVALVGASGSGKSTLGLLVPRFYDVQAGAVRLDGTDVRDVTLASLRAQIGVVPEEAFLFSASVRDNIAYGVPDATDAQVEAAARVTEADAFIRALPDGYATVVGEQGLTLSGGQRQQVALARALLTDPRVLLLDDATSALDARVEAEVFATLQRVTGERTTLVIAHRRSTLALADRVVLLDAGRVVASGTQQELMERSPLFRRLLAGPGDGAEGTAGTEELDAGDLLPEPAVEEQQVDGVTPSLWPPPQGDARLGVSTAEAGPGRLGRGGGGGRGGGRGGGGGPVMDAMASVPASPELLDAVDALPPADDEPGVDLGAAERADPAFGLRALLRPLRLALALAVGLVGVDALASLVLPALTRQGIDAHTDGAVVAAAGLALAVVLADWLVTIGQTLVTGRLGERLLFTLRVKTFAQLQRLGLDYYERELAGRIMTRMTTDVDALSSFLQSGVATAVVSLLSIGGVLVAMLLLDARLAVAVIALLPVLVVATLIYRRVSKRAYTDARERVSAVNADLQENLAGVRIAQAFTREQRNIEHFRDLADSYRRARMRAQTALSTYFPFVEFLSAVATALVLGLGAERVRDGSLSAGALVAFVLYVDLFFSPVQSLSQVFDGYQQAQVGLRRISELLRTPTSVPTPAHPLPVPPLTGDVALEGVTFRYAGARADALSEVTVRIPAGQTVALVGETGAGKSTLVKLVARFYDPTTGAVRVDGLDLRALDPSDYRRRLGLVPQEPYLFSGSVRDTVAYARPDATDAEVEAAARAVGAHDVVARLPEGYRTRVGERGRALSAGQRQLLSLARAELADPDVLLLDEATAALDLASEAAYVAATQRVSRRRTTLVVAHRLTTAARADRVLVLDAGRVVEDGTHAALLAAGGVYAALWAAYAGEPAAA